MYKCHYPNEQVLTCRGAKQSPLFAQLAAQGAFFRDVSGFESADWFAAKGAQPDAAPHEEGLHRRQVQRLLHLDHA